MLPETFESVTQQAAFGKSIASWVAAAKAAFQTLKPFEVQGANAIDREQTVRSLKHLTAMIESGKYGCPEVATALNVTSSETTFYFKVKGM